MIKYNETEFINVCSNSKSMSEAASILNIHFNTFRNIAKKLNCYNINQGGKGIIKNMPSYKTEDILNGLYPQYQTFKLKNRLFNEKIKINKCEICEISEWNGKKINCELDHIDGNRTNHKLENLRILCPNCHSQTENFRAKNKSLSKEI